MKMLFARYGRIESVFVQRQRRLGRKFRFGFIRFKIMKEVVEAAKNMIGWQLNSAYLHVNVAKFPTGLYGYEKKKQGKKNSGARGSGKIGGKQICMKLRHT